MAAPSDPNIARPHIRIGHGYDLHRLEPIAPDGDGKPFILAGVSIDHDRGPIGHSNGDAVYHAVTDAILGALGESDIGQRFPDTDPQWTNADSELFLRDAARCMTDAGYAPVNIDITVICEQPKIAPHKRDMIANLARAIGCDASQLNLKGKTHERVDAVGEGRAIEVHAVALIARSA